jgi:nucleotide-binding universal stress UspA family protein
VFSHIVVAVDGSRHSSKTIPVTVDLAQKYSSAVTVLHVREHERYEGDDVDLGPEQSAEQVIEQATQAFREASIETNSEIRRVRPGHTAQQIVDVAKEAGADLIVIGSRGMTEWRSLLLGGVATKVTSNAECSVLLVR